MPYCREFLPTKHPNDSEIKNFFFFLIFSVSSFGQNTFSGNVSDENGTKQGQVLVLNSMKNQSVFSDVKGNFAVTADIGDEIRFVKDGFYRSQIQVTEKALSGINTVNIKQIEILIPEVKLQFQPTGNLEKDAKNVGISKRVSALNSSMDEYMKSPLTEAMPENSTPKSFKTHDFTEGQVNLIAVAGLIGKLINKASKPKITKANYYETRDFISRLKAEIDLNHFKKFGMSEEGIDRFLLYAEDIFMLSTKYRKDFDKVKISNDLMSAFGEYKKTNNLEL